MVREVCRDYAETIFVRLFRLWEMERHGSANAAAQKISPPMNGYFLAS